MGSSKRKDRRNKQQGDPSSKPFLQAPVILERRDRAESSESTTTTAAAAAAPPQQQRQARHVATATTVRQVEIDNTIRLAPKPSSAPVPSTPGVVAGTVLPGAATATTQSETAKATGTVPFFGKQTKLPSEVAHKLLGEAPGHFVVGVVGQQGVGKSTVLSWFMEDSSNTFPAETPEAVAYNRHQTSGIDILVSPEHTVLLDTEPLLSASILDETLRTGSTEGLHPEVWLEVESLYNLVFMLSVCNVVIVVSEGTEIDTAIIKLLRRAEMMKFNIPDFPLIPPANFGQTQVDTSYYADIVFACNKCRDWEFQWRKYEDMQLILHETFSDSKLKTSGLVSLGKVLPAFEGVGNTENLFFLPYSPDDAVPKKEHDIWNVYDRSTSGIESFDTLMQALREQVVAAPRRQGKKGQVSEKEWYRNAIKIHELIRKSEYIAEFIKTAMKMVQK